MKSIRNKNMEIINQISKDIISKSNLNKFKERALTLDAIGLMYILLVGGLCHILPIPEIVKGFLALPGFLIIPYYIGDIMLEVMKKQTDWKVLNRSCRLILSWCIGYLFMVFMGIFLFGLRIFDFSLYFIAILSFIFFGKFYFIFRKKNIYIFKINFYYDNIPIILMLLFLSLVVPLLFSYFFSFPQNVGYDIFRHTHYSLRIIDFNFLTFTSEYFPSLYIILSTISYVFNVEVWVLLWGSKFLLSTLLVFGTFLFSYEISNDKRVSVLSAAIAPWMFILGFNDSFHSLFAIQPKTLLYAVLPLSLYMVIKGIRHIYLVKNEYFNKETEIIKAIIFSFIILLLVFLTKIFLTRPHFEILLSTFLFFILIIVWVIYMKAIKIKGPFLIFIIIGCTLVFTHIPMGFAAISIIFISLIFYFSLFKRKYGTILLYLIVFFIFIFIALELIDIIQLPVIKLVSLTSVTPVPEQYDFFNVHHKLDAFQKGYSTVVAFLFITGLIFSLYKRDLIYALPTSFLLFMFFLPIEMIYRILVVLTPFVCYFTSFAIFAIVEISSFKNNQNFKKYFAVFLIFCIIVILIPAIVNNYSNYAPKDEKSMNENINFMRDILVASDWVKENTKKNTLILSDPFTMFEVAGLADRAYLSRSLDPDRIFLLYDIFSSPPPQIHKKISSLDPTAKFPHDVVTMLPEGCIQLYPSTDRSDWETLIIIVGNTNRFIKTYKEGGVFVSGVGYYPMDKNFLNKFNNTALFEQVYANENKIYIFKVKKQSD